MKKYTIPCSWEMCGEFVCEAESFEDAVKQAENAPLPYGEYVDSSFRVDHQVARELNPEEA